MVDFEDPIVTLVRLLRKNVAVINDDGSDANLRITRELLDRELLKTVDGQITVGQKRPTEIKPLVLDHSTVLRLTSFNIDAFSIDREGKPPGTRTRSKIVEEILRVCREKRFVPHQALYSFNGLTTTGQHDAYHAAAATELVPSSGSWTEFINANYQAIWASDDARFSKSTSVNLQYAMMLFKIKLETTKYDPWETCVSYISALFEGYGTAPGGNGVTIKIWNHVTSAWENAVTGTASSDEQLIINLSSSLTNYILQDATGIGYIYVLARTKNPSDGSTAALLNCDYVRLGLTARSFTSLRIQDLIDADEINIKPYLWHTTLGARGWLVDTIQASTSFQEPPSPPLAVGYHSGWGGYYDKTEPVDIPAVLDDLLADGQDCIRYWVRPEWLYGVPPDNKKGWSDTIGDAIVQGAEARNIVVYLDPEHNFPPSAYITPANKDQWKADLLTICNRYKDYKNVVIEPVNEYSGSDQIALFGEISAYLRANGIHLPLHYTLGWWGGYNQPNALINDPDNNYSIGRHLYPSNTLALFDHTIPTTIDHVANHDYSGGNTVNKIMDKYFHSTTETFYYQKAKSLGVPNGWALTEVGPGTDETGTLNDPKPGGMCYDRRILEECKEHHVAIALYRIGNLAAENKKALYLQRCLDYFEVSLYP